jgi:glyoxylase-like metal-dependent hydrolase (beta-lactamase superfamily II)
MTPLEDSWSDVIRKARRGLGISGAELAGLSGVLPEELEALEKGRLDLELLTSIAPLLRLDQRRLLALTRGEYHPGALELPEGMKRFTSPWNDFEVHSYLLWDRKSLEAIAFDTGSDATEVMEFIKDQHLTLRSILLTHGHGDHVFELERLMERTGASAWIGEREQVEGAVNFVAGREFVLDAIKLETRSTWGHSSGGITYVIHGLDRPVAIVGDALFAGSMGGANSSYAASLETNRREILSLPPDTLLCPGHGPLTTVALERANNPFFPEMS